MMAEKDQGIVQETKEMGAVNNCEPQDKNSEQCIQERKSKKTLQLKVCNLKNKAAKLRVLISKRAKAIRAKNIKKAKVSIKSHAKDSSSSQQTHIIGQRRVQASGQPTD